MGIPHSRHKMNPRVIWASFHLIATIGFIPGKGALFSYEYLLIQSSS